MSPRALHLRAKRSAEHSDEHLFRLVTSALLSSAVQTLAIASTSGQALKSVRHWITVLDFAIYGCHFGLLVTGILSIRLALIWAVSRFSTRSAAVLSWLIGVLSLWFWMLSLYSVTHYGIVPDSPQVFDALEVQSTAHDLKLDSQQFALFAALTLAALILESAMAWLVATSTRLRSRFERTPYRRTLIVLALYLLLFWSWNDQTSRLSPESVPREVLPFYNRLYPAPSIHLKPEYRVSEFKPPIMTRRPDVLLVLADAFRWDNINAELTPNLFRLQSDPRCMVSRRHYPGGHLTQYGVFPLLYGLASHHFIPFSEARLPSLALESFRANGYRLVAFDNSGLDLTTPPSAAIRQFDRHHPLMAHDDRDQDDLEGIRLLAEELSNPQRSQPLLSLNFLYATHEIYYSPASQKSHTTCPLEAATQGRGQRERINRYHNSVRFVDQMIGTILTLTQARRDRGELVLAFTGDHGEELFDFGGQGHAGVRFEDARSRTPLLLCLPEKMGDDVPLSRGEDVLPTILDWASRQKSDAPVKAAWKQWFSGKSLLDPTHRPSYAVISGADFPVRGRKFAIASENRKYHLSIPGDDPTSFDLEKIGDPADRDLLISEMELKRFEAVVETYKNEFGSFLNSRGRVGF